MQHTPQKLFIDLETTGLEPDEGACILSVGAVTSDGHEFYGVVKPTEMQWKLASPDALKLNGFTWEQLEKEGRPLSEVAGEFVQWLADHCTSDTVYVGMNPSFDQKFMFVFFYNELAFVDVNLSKAVDVRRMYMNGEDLRLVPRLSRRSGENISRALGVTPEDSIHNALEGAKVVMRNYDALIKILTKKEE